ncbi:S41 family peptidase [Sphingobacterium lactis]|uniref:S41 family peptidase n=1 Tax=Sphingobacterium TaxID=28453 RepID=UPI00257E0727|nr:MULTISPECIES: S41 family peptidase [Sphingobacterium]
MRHTVWALLLLALSACKKDGPEPDYPAGSNRYINDWILDSMQVYYYWNTSLPKNPDLDKSPLNFFAALKNPQDRFSRLYNASVSESFYPSPVHSFGFELILYENTGGDVQATVALVVPGSVAQNAGVQRGQTINRINGTQVTENNIQDLIRTSVAQRTIALEIAGAGTITLSAGSISENSVYLYKVFDDMPKPTAYLFYNSFDGRYRQNLQQAFAAFKYAGATELILDLRYNAGGDVGVCAALAAVLSKVNATDSFLEYRGNSHAGTRKETFAKTISKTYSGTPFSFTELQNMRLSLDRVFILTGGHTASAAEFLIKALRPYTEVIQIGERTLGKDMASFSIKDNNSGKNNTWNIEPLVFKLYNARSEGDYPSGLEPDIAKNELSSTLLPLGDPDDPLIREALIRIGGRTNKANRMTKDGIPRIRYDSRGASDLNTNFIIKP